MTKKKTTKKTKKGKYIIHDGEVKTYKSVRENEEKIDLVITAGGFNLSSNYVLVLLETQETKEEIKYYGYFYKTKKEAEKVLMDMKDREIEELKSEVKRNNAKNSYWKSQYETYRDAYYYSDKKADSREGKIIILTIALIAVILYAIFKTIT